MPKEISADKKMKMMFNEFGEIIRSENQDEPQFGVSLEVDPSEPVPEFSFPTFTPPEDVNDNQKTSVTKVSTEELNALKLGSNRKFSNNTLGKSSGISKEIETENER